MASVFAAACGGSTKQANCDPGDSWCHVADGSAPRLYHSAVWTGKELLVWGGLDGTYDDVSAKPLGTGFRLDPDTGRTMPMNTAGAPSARHSHFAVWTGHVMIVWGGRGVRQGGTVTRAVGGAAYDPATDSWETITEPSGISRSGESVAWTGTELFVWGGDDGGPQLRNGFLYEPKHKSFKLVETDTPEAAVIDADAVAVDGQVLLTGGKTNFPDASPLVYDTNGDSWMNASRPAPVPGTDGLGAPAFAHAGAAYVCNFTQGECAGYEFGSASWLSFTVKPVKARAGSWPAWTVTDKELVLFGLAGDTEGPGESIASYYDFDARRWTPLPSDGAPAPKRGQSATWTGESIVFWGGTAADGLDTESGYTLKWP